jgi:hypothetical protein
VSRTDHLIGWTLAAIGTLGMSWLSQVPIAQPGADGAELRLAWRARPERIEQCEEQSAEALAALPAHMRRPVLCEGFAASYRLEVRHNGQVLAEQHVQPGGFRRDRPLYVFRELAVPAGEADVMIRFVRVEQGTVNVEAGDLTEAVPPALLYERRLHFAPGRVRLISYDPARRELFEVQPPG